VAFLTWESIFHVTSTAYIFIWTFKRKRTPILDVKFQEKEIRENSNVEFEANFVKCLCFNDKTENIIDEVGNIKEFRQLWDQFKKNVNCFLSLKRSFQRTLKLWQP